MTTSWIDSEHIDIFGITLICFSVFVVIFMLLVIVGYKYSIREHLIFQNKRILSSEKKKFNIVTKLTHLNLSKQSCENKRKKRKEEGGNIT